MENELKSKSSRLPAILFGILCIDTGIIFVFVTLRHLCIVHYEVNSIFGYIINTLQQIVMSVVLLAFGIIAFLHGLKCTFNRKEWFNKLFFDISRSKLIKIFITLGSISLGFFIIARVIKLFIAS